MSTQQQYCLAPRGIKKFTFPVPNVSNISILRPSIYQRVKKTKSINKFNKKSYASQVSHLTQIKPKPNKIKRKSKKRNKGLTFHFVGIPPNLQNKSHKTTLQLDDIDLDSIVTVKSSLKTYDTIRKLKQFIYKTFSIPTIHNLLIFYSHLILSNGHFMYSDSQNSTVDKYKSFCLNDFGITNQSLFIVAICPTINIFDHNQQKCVEKNMSRNKFEIKCMQGFDIITQEKDIDVYRMPSCGHLMSKDSLYEYALTRFKDKNNLHLQCPHPYESKESDEKYEKYENWQCIQCTYINTSSEQDDTCAICDAPKPWICSKCTFLNDGKYKRCQICEHYKSIHDTFEHKPKQIYCNEIWDYSLIKNILMAKDSQMNKNENDNYDKRQQLMNKYYDLRYKYSKLKIENTNISIEFQIQIRNIQKQLITEFNIDDKIELMTIRTKANIDVMKHKYCSKNKLKFKSNKCYESTAKLELLCARNNIQSKYNLQKCPQCNTLYYKPKTSGCANDTINKPKSMKEIKAYETECVMCDNVHSFCFCCGKAWTNGHLCDSTFRLQLIEILKNAQTKTIGNVSNVPSIRCCPSCCQLITHTEACKHMSCSQCKTKFCFVCMKLYENGSWQCGSSSAKCPIAPRQNIKSLPNTVAILEKSFQLF